MLFNSVLFAIFFAVFFALYTFAARTSTAKQGLILIGSCVFYAGWDYRFVPLLLGTAIFDFFIARAMEAARADRVRRKRLLVLSIIANLGVLGFFKYADFFLGSTYGLMDLVGISPPSFYLDVALPVGISFYTFQSMSYTIDVYRGTLNGRSHPLGFLAGVAFFPHLVAGPIIRSAVLLPQFESFRPLPWQAYRRGLMLIAVGLFNKAIADLLGRVVDRVYGAPGAPTMLDAWTGTLAMAGQVYGDFSGYTDIAIGVALLLGFEIPANFDLPYLSRSPVEVWRRWHISLSTWLRDYVYLALVKHDYLAGRNPRPYRALFITVLLAGVWHGATWMFVAWGLVQGTILTVNHVLFDRYPQFKRKVNNATGLAAVLAIGVTFYLWLLGMITFRAPNIGKVGQVIRAMHFGTSPGSFTWSASLTLFLVIVALITGHAVSWLANRHRTFQDSIAFWPMLVLWTTFALAFGGLASSFVYFQF
jgi:D-alanyl-lipoteichoic acid acyltransferase DltB (MBOAT superfamily)